MAFVQRRKGPDVVGSFGLLQPLADGFKLVIKEPISPSSANFSLFRMAPMATFMFASKMYRSNAVFIKKMLQSSIIVHRALSLICLLCMPLWSLTREIGRPSLSWNPFRKPLSLSVN
ncbi:putative NADH:ubiquinone reductase (H(+)-translocating) [Helianthus anomalus]